MWRVVITFGLLACRPSPTPSPAGRAGDGFPESWARCSQDDQCVVVRTDECLPCDQALNRFVVVHREHADQARRRAGKDDVMAGACTRAMSCELVVRCDDGHCRGTRRLSPPDDPR